jgi:hypothetical protein
MKEAYYFSHDSNAKDDPKCVLLIEQLGLEGYGIYWVLIEVLRDQSTYKYPVALLPSLSRKYNTTFEKMKTVVYNYGLFTVDENDFFSLSLMERMENYEHKRLMASKAGKKSAEQRLLVASATNNQQAFNGCSTDVQPNKLNKIKENNNSIPPTIEEVSLYCLERKNGIVAQKFIDYYEMVGWKVGNKKMVSWKAAVRTWENREKGNYPITPRGAVDEFVKFD